MGETPLQGHRHQLGKPDRIKEGSKVPQEADIGEALRSGDLDLQSSAESSSEAGAALEGSVPELCLCSIPLGDVGLIELHHEAVQHRCERNRPFASTLLWHKANEHNKKLHGDDALLHKVHQREQNLQPFNGQCRKVPQDPEVHSKTSLRRRGAQHIGEVPHRVSGQFQVWLSTSLSNHLP